MENSSSSGEIIDDDSETEREAREAIHQRYKNNPEIKKYEKFIDNITKYLNNLGEKSIDEILNETIINFFELKSKLYTDKIHDLMNRLAMLYHKLKQISFFNLMITYCHFLQKISKNI